jgi:hypothetical protein
MCYTLHMTEVWEPLHVLVPVMVSDCKHHIFSRQLKLEKYVIPYPSFRSNLFIWIDSCGGEGEVHENFKGGGRCKILGTSVAYVRYFTVSGRRNLIWAI